MEAAIPLNIPQVRSLPDRVVIDGVQVRDETAIRLLNETDDPVALILKLIEVGARVLDRETSGAQAEAMRLELEKASSDVRNELGQTAQRLTGETREKLNELFGSGEAPGAVPKRVEKIVVEAISHAQEAMVRHVTSDSSPLAQVNRAQTEMARERHEQSQREFKSLRDELASLKLQLERTQGEENAEAAVAAEAERGTAKGRTYEESVFAALEALAIPQGDDCEATGDLKAGTGKKGDVVVSIGACTGPARGRIAFEAKNSRMSRPDALRELDAVKAERNADFAVLVVPSEEKVPARMLALREYNGDKLIVTYDPDDSELCLQVAYSLARARVLMTRSEGDDVDPSAIAEVTERALQAMSDVVRIKQQLTASKTSIDKAGEIVETMATTVRGHLTEIDALLR
ncbi:MAG TPA: DUF2130 domain-containing protein [Baekduia sp.]|nr:DUF2130 domain-containing protein [Baekduia sp.]